MKKTAILIGFGGMGKRYFQSLQLMNFKIIAICEKKEIEKKILKLNTDILITKNFNDLLDLKADLLCVASNTNSRCSIIKKFSEKKNVKRIITEKPLATSLYKCYEILKSVKKNKIRLIINTHRTFSPNYVMIKNLFSKKKEKITSIIVNSPSAGLGNMGSTFFDFGFYFFETHPISVFGSIDKTRTLNPRGKEFRDPGGYGIINFNQNKKLFFDLSENTGLPYTLLLKSKNYEVKIDEINNQFELIKRPNDLRDKPLYYYLFKPIKIKLKPKHKFDVVKMTCFSISQLFKKNFKNDNLKKSIQIMECIFATHISSEKKQIVTLPISRKYYRKEINFA